MNRKTISTSKRVKILVGIRKAPKFVLVNSFQYLWIDWSQYGFLFEEVNVKIADIAGVFLW